MFLRSHQAHCAALIFTGVYVLLRAFVVSIQTKNKTDKTEEQKKNENKCIYDIVCDICELFQDLPSCLI